MIEGLPVELFWRNLLWLQLVTLNTTNYDAKHTIQYAHVLIGDIISYSFSFDLLSCAFEYLLCSIRSVLA